MSPGNFNGIGPWGPGWPGCCCADCLLKEDTFNPPCHGNLNPDDWFTSGAVTVVDPVGDDCSSNGQYLSVGAGAFAVMKFPYPDPPYYPQVNCGIGDAAGSKPRLLLNVEYNPATDVVGKYLWVEADAAANTLIFGSGEGLTQANDVILATYNQGYADGDILAAYLNKEVFSAGLFGNCLFNGGWVCQPGGAQRYVGVSNGGSAAAQFYGGPLTGFRFERHTDNLDPCGDCDCLCEEHCLPREGGLKARWTILSGAECCNDIDGAVVTGTFDTTDADTPCKWEFELGADFCGFDQTIGLHRGESRNPSCYEFSIDDTAFPGWGQPSFRHPDYCECDPFYARWDYTVAYDFGGGEVACNIRLEIYEE